MYGYNPYLQANYQPNYQQNTTPLDERIWVQNETSAEAYLLAPNGFARLWDSSTNRFYEKRADATGRPLPMDVYEYTRVTAQNGANNEKVDKSMYDELNGKIDAITERIDALEKSKRGAGKNVSKSYDDDTSV